MKSELSDTNPFDWLSKQGDAADMIEDQAQAMELAALERLRVARAINDVLTTVNGSVLLTALEAITIDVPLMNTSAAFVEGEAQVSAAEWAFYREGQNSIVRYLLGEMAFANNPPAFLTGETDNDADN